MSNLWEPVHAAVVEAAWQARERGLSLRAIAAELAGKGTLSPSDRPYLPGSIAAMLRPREYPAAAHIVDDDLEVEIDVHHSVDAAAVAPIVDAAVFDAAHGLQALDASITQQPFTEPTPQTFDAVPAEPIVDAAPVKPQWQPRRGAHGLIDFRSLLQRLGEVPHLQEAAMASVNLRLDQMGLLADRGDWRESVANWLVVNA